MLVLFIIASFGAQGTKNLDLFVAVCRVASRGNSLMPEAVGRHGRAPLVMVIAGFQNSCTIYVLKLKGFRV